MADVSEQLRWEARWAKPAALAAFGYALLTVASSVYVAAGLDSQPDNTRELLGSLNSESGVFVVSVIVQAVALLLLAAPLVYLFGVVKARRPELLTVALYLAIGGPLLLAVAGILSQLDRIDNAGQFFASGARTEERAKDVIVERGGAALGFGLAGSMAFGIALVLLNVNAIRAGIESRFMGIIGAIVGALPVLAAVIPLVSAGFVQLFWVVALGMLFLGRWPGGRGPAWETGEAIPWPSAAQRREEVGGAQAERSPGDGRGAAGAAEDAAGSAGGGQPGQRRKRKKRKR